MADGSHDGVSERNSAYRQPVSAKQNQLGGRKPRIPKAKSTPLTVFFLTVKWPAEEPFLPPTDVGHANRLPIKRLKSRDKLYKVADRDGMYIAMAPSGQITFRYDYRLNGRRETLTIGRYGADGVSLSEARERCLAARKEVSEGRSPAQAKQRAKRKLAISQNFGAVGKRWFKADREDVAIKDRPAHRASALCHPSVLEPALADSAKVL